MVWYAGYKLAYTFAVKIILQSFWLVGCIVEPDYCNYYLICEKYLMSIIY